MLKRLTVAFTIAAFLLTLGFAKDGRANSLPAVKDNRIQVLVPGTQRHMPMNLVEKAIGSQDGLEIGRVKTSPARVGISSAAEEPEVVLWNLTHADDVAEYYLGSGAAGDTFAIVFTPAAPCSVVSVYHQWNSAGTVDAFGAKYGPASELSPDGQSQDVVRGSTNLSPIGELVTALTPNTIEGVVASYSAAAKLDIGGTFIVGDPTDLTVVEPFVIAFVKGAVDPYPLADATDDQGLVSYTWFGGPWNATQAGLWGRYSNETENMCLVKVAYNWGAPIAIQAMDLLPNTYMTDYTVTVLADLFDDVDDVTGMAIDGDDEIMFHYVFQGDTTPVALTADAVGAEGNGIYKADIDYLGGKNGDVIEYWITTIDNDDLASESVHLSFKIVKPGNPYADLLLIEDSPIGAQEDVDLYRTVLDDNNIVYEFWDASAMQGIDSSVINHGWSNIIVYGWGSKTVPMDATDDDPGYGVFLDGGGNLLLIDCDWFLSHTSDAVVSFAADDFAYDYFGIAGGENDPMDGDDNSLGDTSATGYGVTPIDIPFETVPLVLEHYIYGTSDEDFDANWADYLTAGTGTPIFLGEQSGEDVGIVNTGGGVFKAVYLAFTADAAVDTTEAGLLDYTPFATLLEGALDYFGVTSPPHITHTPILTTALAGPYEVAATIVDVDGEAITANLFFSSDSGETFETVAMTAVGDVYTADITEVAERQWLFYYIEAADAGADSVTYPDANTPALEFYYYLPSVADVLFVDDTEGYGGYFNDFYTEALDSNDVVYDFYEIYDFGLPDETVFATANYSTIIWNGEYEEASPSFDWATAKNPLAAFIDAGGDLLMTGDEALANGYGWPGFVGEFEAGDVGLDFFGLVSAWSDGNPADSLVGVADDPITGAFAALDKIPYAPPFGLDDFADNLVIGLDTTAVIGTMYDTTYAENGDTIIATYDTLDIATKAWYGTRYNSGTHKAIFIPLYFSGFDSTTRITLMDNALVWLDTGTVVGVAGIIGPEQLLDIIGVELVSLDTFAVPPASIAERGSELPTEFAVKSNYPNPFNPSTIISFDIAEADHVTLRIYNLLGQEVATLHDVFTVPGRYRVVWNATNAAGQKLPSGIYFYRVVSGKNSGTGKMVLLQ